MKSVVRFVLIGLAMAAVNSVQAQKIDEERMQRDIEVGENVLQTLIKQQFNKRNYFPMDVSGKYLPGYGVTFHLPNDLGGPMMYFIRDTPAVTWDVAPGASSGDGNSYSYSYSYNVSPTEPPGIGEIHEDDCSDCERDRAIEEDKAAQEAKEGKHRKADRKATRAAVRLSSPGTDSLANELNQKLIQAAKDFLADYGDLIGQLQPNEKIIITNRNDGYHQFWYGDNNKRKMLSIEVTKGDISQFKANKLTRAQFMSKVNVVNSETSDELSPDLELLSSIFNRLYSPDLSKTFYSQGNISYEHLKDYGAIYYMQVFSSNEDGRRFSMPTLNLHDMDQKERNAKVVELYPLFEKDLKESMVDYGRTLKSLKDNESLVFNVQLTKCSGCGIPSTLEVSVKNLVLKDYSTGKISKEAAVAKVEVKKGPAQ